MDVWGDLALKLDRVAFARRVGMGEVDPWQERLLRSRADRVLLNASRQAGKSSVSAVVGLHRAVFFPGSLVLILAPALRQAQELFLKVKGYYHSLHPEGADRNKDAPLKLSLELANGSRILTLPGTEKTIRGFSDADLILVDEASRIEDALAPAIRPMLAVSGGSLYMMSTPAGKRGVFYESWKDGGPEWERYEVPATDVPRISPKFLKAELKALGPYLFEQEYMCVFHEIAGAVFSEQVIKDIFTDDVAPLFPDARPMTEDDAA